MTIMIRSDDFLETHAKSAAIVICSLAVLFYSLLVWAFPVVHWYDAHIRLALRDRILLGHWLPLVQALTVLVSKFTHDLLVLRILLAVGAGCALFCMYVLARHLFSSGTALVAVALLAANMMFTALATVPYPEVLFVGLLLLTLYLLDAHPSGKHFLLGMLTLNLACLTRYEGWLLAGIFVVHIARETLWTKNWKKLIRTALLAGIAPLGWLMFGVSGSGSLLDRLKAVIAFEVMTDVEGIGGRFLSHLNWDYLRAFASNYWHLLNSQAGAGIVFLGAIGWLSAMFSPRHRAIHRLIFIFMILDWLLLALWQPWDFTNLRTAFIGEAFLLLYAAHGLRRSIHFVFQRAAKNIFQTASLSGWENRVVTFFTLLIAWDSASAAVGFVRTTSQEKDFANPAHVGNWLNKRLDVDDAVLSLTDDVFQPYALAAYTGFDYDAILDDRFDDREISDRLERAQAIYIVESYRMRDGLSQKESNLLKTLEDGTVGAQSFTIGSTRVWLVQHTGINTLKAIYK